VGNLSTNFIKISTIGPHILVPRRGTRPAKWEFCTPICVQEIRLAFFLHHNFEVPILKVLERLGKCVQSADTRTTYQRQPSSRLAGSGVIEVQESVRRRLQV